MASFYTFLHPSALLTDLESKRQPVSALTIMTDTLNEKDIVVYTVSISEEQQLFVMYLSARAEQQRCFK